MVNKKTTLIIFVLLVIILVAGYTTYSIRERNALHTSDAAQTLGTPESTAYTTLTGESVDLDQFNNSVRVVNSWATWSPFSRRELLDLQKLATAYEEEGVVVIAINRNEDPVRARKFIEQLGDVSRINFIVDGVDSFYDRMGGQAMPESLFFNAKGEIVHHVRGDITYEKMEEFVNLALQK